MSKKDLIVDVKGFGMDFAGKTVIKELSFDVRKGEIFGLLGSNGSGKTTTIRALLGLYEPTRGELLLDGEKFRPDGRVKVGYLPEDRGLYKKESVIDVMVYFGRLKGMRDVWKWSMEYLERVGLSDLAGSKIDKLSNGQHQKVQLGLCVMNDPDLLILDEPTKGFDPVNRRLLMEIIDEQHARGATILMITHFMEDVERLCDRALLLKDGKARAYGTIKEIRKQFGGISLDDVFVKVYNEQGERYA